MVSCNIQYGLWAPYYRSDWGSQRLLHAQDPPASGWTSLWWKRRSIHGSVNTHSILTAQQAELRTGVQRIENSHLLSVWAKSSFFFIKLFCSSFIWKHFLLKPENEKKKEAAAAATARALCTSGGPWVKPAPWLYSGGNPKQGRHFSPDNKVCYDTIKAKARGPDSQCRGIERWVKAQALGSGWLGLRSAST